MYLESFLDNFGAKAAGDVPNGRFGYIFESFSEHFPAREKMSNNTCPEKCSNIFRAFLEDPQNRCQNHEKTIKKSIQKKGRKTEVRANQARGTLGSGKRNNLPRKTTKGRQPEGEEFREEHAERPTSPLQHASGAFRPGADIYWAHGRYPIRLAGAKRPS